MSEGAAKRRVRCAAVHGATHGATGRTRGCSYRAAAARRRHVAACRRREQGRHYLVVAEVIGMARLQLLGPRRARLRGNHVMHPPHQVQLHAAAFQRRLPFHIIMQALAAQRSAVRATPQPRRAHVDDATRQRVCPAARGPPSRALRVGATSGGDTAREEWGGRAAQPSHAHDQEPMPGVPTNDRANAACPVRELASPTPNNPAQRTHALQTVCPHAQAG